MRCARDFFLSTSTSSNRFHSLQGQYLAIAGVLTLLVLCGAIAAQIYLTHTETRNRANLETRNEVAEFSRRIRNAIWLAEDVQKVFLLTPLKKYRHTFDGHIESALRDIGGLQKAAWIRNAGLEADIQHLYRDVHKLKQASAELAEIRTHVERLYPITAILQKTMSASNRDFYTAASLGLNEFSSSGMTPVQREIHEIFEASQHEWVLMISNFRLYLLNLSGVFGDPASSLQAHTRNIDIHYQQLRHLLDMLEERESSLGLQGSQSLADMRHSADEWWQACRKLQTRYADGEWRTDASYMKDHVQPLYDTIWRHLTNLDRRLENAFARDLDSLGQVARSSIQTLWGLAGLMLLVIAGGYLYLQRRILQPVHTVTHALRAEIWEDNIDIENMGPAHLRETRDLFQAFSDTAKKIRERQSQLEYQATHDALTSLPNRIQLNRQVRREIEHCRPRRLSVALLLLDLDRFKEINDTLGHQLGDQVLQNIAKRLLSCLRQRDFIARLGGDEFALLLSGVTLDYAEEVAQRIVQVLQQPLAINRFQLRIGGSIGIALFPLHGEDPDTLIRCADVAMYESKRLACGYMIYDPARDPNSVNRLALVSDFHAALEQDELCLYYQPKVDVKSGRVIGAEALLRWQHPVHGFIPPDELIPLAEQTGLIKELTHWVLNSAMRECAGWLRAGLELHVAVNLSMWDLQDPRLAEHVEQRLAEYGLGPEHLVLEITESAMMADPEHAIDTMNRLAGMGIQLAVDDFGTGFSSLSYLKKLPIHELKIDKSFVMDMCRNDHDAVLVRSTIDLSHNLGLSVVAEGVEDQEIWDLLEILRCDKLQGYYISRPMEAGIFTEWLQGWKIYPALTRHQALLKKTF